MYTYIIYKSEDLYVAFVPELPGVVAQAEDIDALKERIQDATKAYLEVLSRENLCVPKNLEFVDTGELQV